MIRRLFSFLLVFLLLAPGALAEVTQIPTKDVFSLGYDRLQKAIVRERPVEWSAWVEPREIGNLEGSALEVLSALLSGLEFSGILQCFKEGGRLEANVLSGGETIASIGQMTQDGRLGLNLTGEWLSISKDALVEAAAKLELDEFGKSLMDFDYTGIRSGDMPFLSAIYKQGLVLWGLASPYSEDSNRLSVPSGATGHGVVYEIDTEGLRSMIAQWADGLAMDGLSLGLGGTDLSLGVSQEAFDAFVEKVRVFGETAELSKPIKFSTTFGEGDVLRTAKGSGTLKEGNKRTGISYSYSCNLSSTRVTRKYSIDFQPKEADTLVLTCTWLTSSNNKTSGAHEVNISASGTYDGEPYRIKVKVDLVNKYGKGEDGILTETITGAITGSLKYAGKTIADVSIKRNGTTESTTGLTSAIKIKDVYDTTIKNDEGTLFEGLVNLACTVDAGSKELPDVMAEATKLENIDFLSLEQLREDLGNSMKGVRQALIQSLPTGVLSVLMNAQ